MSLKDVLSALPDLSPKELETVIATARALQSKVPRKRPTPQVKPAKKEKGPAKRASAFQDVPEYVRFKGAEKQLKAALRTAKTSLKEAEAAPGTIPNSVLEEFHQSRELWFFRKNRLTTNPDHSKNGQEEETKD